MGIDYNDSSRPQWSRRWSASTSSAQKALCCQYATCTRTSPALTWALSFNVEACLPPTLQRSPMRRTSRTSTRWTSKEKAPCHLPPRGVSLSRHQLLFVAERLRRPDGRCRAELQWLPTETSAEIVIGARENTVFACHSCHCTEPVTQARAVRQLLEKYCAPSFHIHSHCTRRISGLGLSRSRKRRTWSGACSPRSRRSQATSESEAPLL